jgi:ATP-dependent Lon protease
MEGKPVNWYADVFDIIFPNVDLEHANKIWKKHLQKPSKSNADENDDD